jgi:uncharacterized ion transporter superfamily protein YfcC
MDNKSLNNNSIDMNKKSKREFPHVLVVLLFMILLTAILTYIIPAGQYERVLNEATGRMVIDPSSFTYIEKSPVGPFDILVSIEEGLIAASGITFLIFMAFSALYVIERTGAIDASIVAMTRKIEKNPKYSNLMIAAVMILISAWGSTGTLSYEEILAFIPIFVTLSLALGYDPLVGIGMSFTSVGVGFASSTINPFTVGISQGIAELPLYSGIGFRIAVLVVMTSLSVGYVLIYASKIKKDPTKSYVYGIDYSDFVIDGERAQTEMTSTRAATLGVLLVGVAIMGYGLINLHWYINQVAAIFMGVTIFAGIVNKWSPNKLASTFVEGLSKGVLSALVVGFARGVLVIMEKGQIIDTVVHGFTDSLSSMGLYLSSIGMLAFQTVLNFLIPSGSGQAAVSMPIMTPIADLIGMNRQIACLIYQFGDGFSNMLWPTGFLLIGCAIAKVPLNKYYRWFLPFFGISVVVQIIFIFIAINMNYGPF